MRRALVVLALFAVTGCGVIDKMFGRDELTVLRRNQGRWRGLAITDYDYTYHQSCFCPYETTRPVRIAVRGGLVTSVIDTLTQQPVPPQQYVTWPTIDSLFAWTERHIVRTDYRLDIVYDGTFHFPGRVAGDVPLAVDDEYTRTANSLVKITP